MSDNFENNTPGETEEVNIEQKTVITIEEEPKKKSVGKEILDWIVSIVVAVVAVLIINQFLFVQVMVDGLSMFPTLHDGDRLFAYRFMYEPKQQDIVVVEPFLKEGTVKGKLMFGRTLYIKRVIATEGQTLKIDYETGDVIVDGVILQEKYVTSPTNISNESWDIPYVIPEGSVFVLGDNRTISLDSRSSRIGLISEEKILGKAQFIIFPFDRFSYIY